MDFVTVAVFRRFLLITSYVGINFEHSAVIIPVISLIKLILDSIMFVLYFAAMGYWRAA